MRPGLKAPDALGACHQVRHWRLASMRPGLKAPDAHQQEAITNALAHRFNEAGA